MKRVSLTTLVVWLGIMTHVYAGEFTLFSPDLQGQITEAQVLSGFGCSGKNISPALKWNHAPKDTKSFAVTMYDPDAPTGSGWWHWVVFNIPADVTALKANSGNISKGLMPTGAVQSITDFGSAGFGGSCPPKGSKPHQYIFTVHALSIDNLKLSKNSSPALVGYMLNANIIAKASIIAYYQR